jgi:hypothetical protein
MYVQLEEHFPFYVSIIVFPVSAVPIMYVINYPFETDSLSSLGHFQSCVCVCVASPPAPPLVQLHCIHCALKTLAGPGEELKMDDEVFVTALRLLVKEIPIHFERWDIALDCLDLSLCKRRETRSSVVLGFVRLLFLHSSHMLSDSVGLALLAMANTVLLKYPRVRCEMQAPLQHGKQEDDEVTHPYAYPWSSHLHELSYRLRALCRLQIRSRSVGP